MSAQEKGIGGESASEFRNRLVQGLVESPFNPLETELLKKIRDGFDPFVSNAARIGISQDDLEGLKESITEKAGQMYKDGGEDGVAKGLALAILGGWIEEPGYKDLKVEISKDEYDVLFKRSFGYLPRQIRLEMHMSANRFIENFLDIKKKLKLKGDYQVIAWGASQAKKYLLEQQNKKQ